MIRRPAAPSPWVAVGAGLVTVGALLCPWARSGTVDRSSIELLGSASALDLLGDAERTAVVVGWFAVVVLVAAALVAVAWGQARLGAALTLPIGPAMVTAWWAVAASPLMVRWGAPMGTVSGVTASVAGALVLLGQGTGGKEPSR